MTEQQRDRWIAKQDGEGIARYTTLRVDAYRLRYLASFVASARRIANMPPLADDIQGWSLDFTGRGRRPRRPVNAKKPPLCKG